DFVESVQTRTDVTEKAIGGFEGIILRVQSVNGDVEGALRQAVDDGAARPSGRACTRQKDHEIQDVASLKRKIGDLFDLQGGRDVGRLRLHYLAAALHNDRFAGGAHFQRHINSGGGARGAPDISPRRTVLDQALN